MPLLPDDVFDALLDLGICGEPLDAFIAREARRRGYRSTAEAPQAAGSCRSPRVG